MERTKRESRGVEVNAAGGVGEQGESKGKWTTVWSNEVQLPLPEAEDLTYEPTDWINM